MRFPLAAFLVLLAAAASAQTPFELMERSPAELVREAFAADYGKKLVARFGRILRETADPECLRSRGIDPASMNARAREILMRSGTRMLETYLAAIDGRKLEAGLVAHAGPGAKAEIARLRNDPDVKRLDVLEAPARSVRIGLNVTENVDRYTLLSRIKLKGRLSPLSDGTIDLLEEQERIEAASSEDVERFVESHKSPQVKRWLELADAFAKASMDAVKEESVLRLGPRQLMQGLDAELAAVCVR